MSTALEIKNLIFSYDKEKNVVNDISFNVERGQYVAIIGHNGSGKSTLAKLILGLLEAKSGSIEVFGEKLDEKNIASIRQKLGIVFQNPDNQFIGSTVRDDIAFGLENRQVKHDDMEGIITTYAKKVNMLEFLDKEPSNLSGGQKQRVAIAGVLAMEPNIVIFDEATAMLDPKGKREIRQIITDMKKEHPELTILSITHDIEEAYLSDEVIVLNEGQIVLQGTPNEVFAKADILKSIRLDLPFIHKMKTALAKEDIYLDDVITFEGLVDALCQ